MSTSSLYLSESVPYTVLSYTVHTVYIVLYIGRRFCEDSFEEETSKAIEWANLIKEKSSSLSSFVSMIRFCVVLSHFTRFFHPSNHGTFFFHLWWHLWWRNIKPYKMHAVRRHRKRFAASNSSCGQTFTTTTGSTQAMSQSSTDVQLSRLRAIGHNPLTEYNPNYEFGGSTSTLQDLKEIPRDKLTLIKWVFSLEIPCYLAISLNFDSQREKDTKNGNENAVKTLSWKSFSHSTKIRRYFVRRRRSESREIPRFMSDTSTEFFVFFVCGLRSDLESWAEN